jgi:tartrate dehydratase beta subunit/fumarate hydratase class I family protein
LDYKGIASQTFKINTIPFLIVVDKKGNIIHKQVGYDAAGEEAFEKRLNEIK